MQFAGIILTFLAGLGGILLNLLTDFYEKWAVGIISGIAFSGSMLMQWHGQRETDKFTFDDEQDYHNKMLSLIKGEQKITIVTTRLDWVTETNEIGRELARKAQYFTLIMHKKNDISLFFASKGARVIYYENLGFKFSGGFTIVGDPDDVHRVALGMKIPNRDNTKPPRRRLHIFRSSEAPAAKLAQCQYCYLTVHGEPHA